VLGGIVIGAGVPAAWRLEFAAPLAFIAMSVPLLRDRAMITAALAAATGIAAGLFYERKKQ
jgi:predicted branched-subunit amino acid permease